MRASFAVVCVAALLTTSACASKNAPLPEPKFASLYISGFSVPKVDNITIDGDAADWGDRGYHIDLFNSVNRHRPAVSDLDVTARLAWSEAGLLALVQVKDDIASEPRDEAALASGDSVELYLVDKIGGTQKLQLTIAPGGTKDHPAMRVTSRPIPAQLPKGTTYTAAATRTSDGYAVEVFVPWNLINLTPHMGDSVGVQLCVNDDDDAGKTERMIWFPRDNAAADSTRVAEIKLSDKPWRPETSAVIVQTELPRVTVQVVTRDSFARFINVSNIDLVEQKVVPGQSYGSAPVNFQNGVGVATLRIGLPLLDMPSSSLRVWIGPTYQKEIILPPLDLKHDRIAMLEDMELKFRPFVFTGPNFPSVDFENPERAEMLIGEYKIATRFFDAEYNEVKKPTKPGRYGAMLEVTAAGFKPFQQFITLYRTDPFKKFDWKSDGRLSLPEEIGVSPEMQVTAEFSTFIKDRFLEGFREDRYTAATLAALSEAKSSEAMPGLNPIVEEHEMHYWYNLRKHIGLPETYPYLAWEPNGGAKSAEKRPLIIFLSGSGERGSDFTGIEFDGPRGYAKRHPEFPFIVISPLCPNGEWWNALRVLDQVDEAVKKYDADPDRVYITGLSMGGFGTWGALQIDPKRFAAAAVVCGGGTVAHIPPMADLPIWVFHGGKDRNVNPQQAFRFVEALRKVQGRVKFTFYPQLAHSIWGPTYNDPRLYDWLLAQKRGQPEEPHSSAPGTQPSEIK